MSQVLLAAGHLQPPLCCGPRPLLCCHCCCCCVGQSCCCIGPQALPGLWAMARNASLPLPAASPHHSPHPSLLPSVCAQGAGPARCASHSPGWLLGQPSPGRPRPRSKPRALALPQAMLSSCSDPCRLRERVRVCKTLWQEGRPGEASAARVGEAIGLAAPGRPGEQELGAAAWRYSGSRGDQTGPLLAAKGRDHRHSAQDGFRTPGPGQWLPRLCVCLPRGHPESRGPRAVRILSIHWPPGLRDSCAELGRWQKCGLSPLPGAQPHQTASSPPPGPARGALQHSSTRWPPLRGPPGFPSTSWKGPGSPARLPHEPCEKFPKVTWARRTPTPSPRASPETPPHRPLPRCRKSCKRSPKLQPPYSAPRLAATQGRSNPQPSSAP